MEIIDKLEAKKHALSLQKIPIKVVDAINLGITNGYANGETYMTFSQPDDMSEVTFQAVCAALKSKGYTIKIFFNHLEGNLVQIDLSN